MSNDPDTIVKLIELEVHKQVENRLSVELEKKTDSLTSEFRETVGKYRRTLRTIGVTVLGALGLSAFTNISDIFNIPEKISSAIESRINTTVESHDVISIYRNKLKDLYIDSIILYKSIKRKESGNHIKIDEDDAVFLVEHLLSQKIGFEQFRRIALLFREQSGVPKDIYKTGVLEALYSAAFGTQLEQKKFGWLLVDSKYGTTLIDGLGETTDVGFSSDVMDRLLPLLDSPRTQRKLRLSIISEGLKRKNESSADAFIKALNKNDEEIRAYAINGLSLLQPNHRSIETYIKNIDPIDISYNQYSSIYTLGKTYCEYISKKRNRNKFEDILLEIMKLLSKRSFIWRIEESKSIRISNKRDNILSKAANLVSSAKIMRGVVDLANRKYLGNYLINNCNDLPIRKIQSMIRNHDVFDIVYLVKLLNILGDYPAHPSVIFPGFVNKEKILLQCNDDAISIQPGTILGLRVVVDRLELTILLNNRWVNCELSNVQLKQFRNAKIGYVMWTPGADQFVFVNQQAFR